MSRSRGHLPILGNKKPMSVLEEFHFPLELGIHSYFHATIALLEYLEIFENFDHNFCHNFESFSTRKSGYDPVGPIVNTSI